MYAVYPSVHWDPALMCAVYPSVHWDPALMCAVWYTLLVHWDPALSVCTDTYVLCPYAEYLYRDVGGLQGGKPPQYFGHLKIHCHVFVFSSAKTMPPWDV